jgi:prevent-host-death family protein
MRYVGSGEARIRFSEMLSDVERWGEHVMILRHNIPAAVCVPREWYERAEAALAREEQGQ